MPVAGGGSVMAVGLGVMGGSVAKAVAKRFPAVPVRGIDTSRANAKEAARDGVEIVSGIEGRRLAGSVVVYALPLDATMSLVESQAAHWSRAALAMDVASLKAPVVSVAEQTGTGPFVGAHPMCGSESSGYGAADADLFEDATVWLCPAGGAAEGEAAGAEVLERAKAFWRALGGKPRVVDPARHDHMMSRASHLPQLAAWALAGVLADDGLARDRLGPGGRDMTRLAASSPDVWIPLLRSAAKEDADALARLERALADARRSLETGDEDTLRQAIGKARHWIAP